MRFALFLVALALSASSPRAQDADPAQTREGNQVQGTKAASAVSPEEFAKRASQINDYEIQAAQTAMERSRQDGIRDFAQDIIRDHKQAQEDLAEAVRSVNLSVEAGLAPEQTARIQALRDASVEEFDAIYLSDQRRSHQEAMDLLSGFAENGEAGPLKTYARAIYPTVRMHLIKARAHSTSE